MHKKNMWHNEICTVRILFEICKEMLSPYFLAIRFLKFFFLFRGKINLFNFSRGLVTEISK